MMEKKLLVTGGAGYVGSHACKALCGAGYTPVTVDNLSTAKDSGLVQFGPFIQLDIRDTISLTNIIQEHQIGTVLHFAGSAYVGESRTNPAKYYSNNVVATHSLLEAMRNGGASRLVFSSSCATYGISQTGYFTEAHVQAPINVYGRTKLYAENLIRDYCDAYGFSACCLRYFNAAGADPAGTLGERHDPETHLIPLAILAALGRGEELKIYGGDYETKDGSCIRDYTHVSDLADAHVLAVEYINDVVGFNALNLGTGKGTSVFDIVRAVELVLGKRVPFQLESRRIGDPAILVARNGLAKERLNWAPKFTDVNEVVRTAAAFFMKNT
jgi:UDP-arabinose 4-epimerase